VAERAHAGDHLGVERLLEENIRLVALVSCPVFAAFCFWGHELALVFGASFRVPQAVMAMLAGGALVTTLTACAGFALSMTGRHKQELYVLSVGLVVTLAACSALIPPWGLTGAATATLVSLISVNAMRLVVVYRAIGAFHLRWRHLGIATGAVLLAWPFSLIRGGESDSQVLRAALCAGAYMLCYTCCAWLMLGEAGRGQVRTLFARRGSRGR
jgi:O-antigen/teichoic acid export membrane protein